MAIGSGLGAQLVVGAETSYGAGATLDHSYEFDSETLHLTPTFTDSTGLHASGRYMRGARNRQSTRSASGTIPMDFVTNKMGLLIKQLLGSAATATQIASTTAYKQVHQPGVITGKSLEFQVGRPQTDGTVKAFTYPGSKLTGGTISCSEQQLMKLSVDIDAQDEVTDTGLASFSPVAGASTFAWQDVTCKIGGTAALASGVVSVSGGADLATLVTGFSLALPVPMATGRFGLGGGGLQAEPIENAFATGNTLTLDGEFTSQAELYDAFRSFEKPAFQITAVGSEIGTSGSDFTVDIILPQTVLKTAAPQVSGTDIVRQQVTADVYDDGTTAPLQITIISSDTTL